MSDVIKSGVQPGHETTLEVCITGRPEDLKTGEYTMIKDLEGCKVGYNGKVESWNPMNEKGWQRNAVTGKSLSIACVAKRNFGDAGNDYVASLKLATGSDCETAVRITYPDGDVMYIPCVINVKNDGADTTALEQLEFDILGDGKPEYVAYQTV